MGYYTDFYLQAAPVTEDQFHSIDSALQELRSMREAYFDGGIGYWENTEDTWYQSFDDMVEISLRFPEVTFTLTGHGDQRDDQWIDYFKNGQVQCCSIYTQETPLRPHRWSDVEKDEHGHYRQTLKLTAKEREHDSLQIDVYQCLLSLSSTVLQFDPEQLERGAQVIAAFLEGEGLTVNKAVLGGSQSPMEEVPMKDNAKRERFKKVAVKRMEKLIADFELLGNCSSLVSYEYTDADVAAIFEEIARQTQILEDRFAGKRTFSLGSEGN